MVGPLPRVDEGGESVEHRGHMLDAANSDSTSSVTPRTSESDVQVPDSATTDFTEFSELQVQPVQACGPVRPTLSVRIQQAVDRGTADLNAKIVGLQEQSVSWASDLAQRNAELETRLFERVEAMLAERDAKI